MAAATPSLLGRRCTRARCQAQAQLTRLELRATFNQGDKHRLYSVYRYICGTVHQTLYTMACRNAPQATRQVSRLTQGTKTHLILFGNIIVFLLRPCKAIPPVLLQT